MYLYHVTTIWNLDTISRMGLCPHRSRGARERVWLTTAGALLWLVNHVTKRDRLNPHEVVVIRVKADKLDLKRTNRKHAFTCDSVIDPAACHWFRARYPGHLKRVRDYRRSRPARRLRF